MPLSFSWTELMILFFVFLLFYSINIEIYANTTPSSSQNVACQFICFLSLVYIVSLEIFQIFYNLVSDKINDHLGSFKNWMEFLGFPLCVVALVCDLPSSDIYLRFSLYSITIMGVYFLFVSRLMLALTMT